MGLILAIAIFIFLISFIAALVNCFSGKQTSGHKTTGIVYRSNFVEASDRQIEFIRILGGNPPARLSMSRASKMIDELIEENNRKRIQKAEDEYNYNARLKEENELKVLASAMRDPNFKQAKKRTRRTKDIYEFQLMVNKINGLVHVCPLITYHLSLITFFKIPH